MFCPTGRLSRKVSLAFLLLNVSLSSRFFGFLVHSLRPRAGQAARGHQVGRARAQGKRFPQKALVRHGRRSGHTHPADLI
jgi:hypothetical protein